MIKFRKYALWAACFVGVVLSLLAVCLQAYEWWVKL